MEIIDEDCDTKLPRGRPRQFETIYDSKLFHDLKRLERNRLSKCKYLIERLLESPFEDIAIDIRHFIESLVIEDVKNVEC